MTVELIQGDCLEVMRGMPDNSVDAVITDPPYGIGKEEWDSDFQTWFIDESFRIADLVIVIPGIWALGKCIQQMGNKYLWTVSGYKGGAMTNGGIGFNKWQPVVIGGNPKHRVGTDTFKFSQMDKGGKVFHSCQKP